MSRFFKLLSLLAFAIVSIVCLSYWEMIAWYLNPNTLYDRALDQVEAGDFASARVTLARLREKRVPTPLDHGLQARVDIAEGRIDEAIQELDAIPNDHELATWARLRAGQLERNRNRFRLAEVHYRKVIELDPKRPEPRRELIYVLGMQLRRQDMHEQFREIARESPLTAKEIYVWCLIRDLAWWEASEQVPILEKAITADAADDRSRAALAEILHRQSETARALEVLEADPGSSLYLRARKLEILLDRDGPEAIVEELKKFEPDEPLVATLRGRIALLEGDGAEAVRCFEIASIFEPGRRQVIADLGRAMLLVGQKEKGQALTELAGRIDVLNNLLLKKENTVEASGPDQWKELAKACEAAGRLPEARAWYGLILSKVPLDEDSQTAIFRIDNAAAAAPK
jgi:predicted Zn-dependent protease